MNQNPIDFKSAFVDLVDAARDPDVRHPDAGELRRLRDQQLPEDDAERLRSHLLTCRECFAQLQSMASAAAPEPSSDFELAAFWKGLKPQLEGPATSRPAKVLPMRPGTRTTPGTAPAATRRFPLALAAAFLIATIGLSLWSAMQRQALLEQRRTLSELTRPQANALILDLSTASSRSTPGGQPVTVMAGAGFTLVLTPAVVTAEGSCELRIRDADGREVHTVTGLARHPQDETFSLWLPPGSLAAGDYELELRDPAGRAETFRLRVRAPS